MVSLTSIPGNNLRISSSDFLSSFARNASQKPSCVEREKSSKRKLGVESPSRRRKSSVKDVFPLLLRPTITVDFSSNNSSTRASNLKFQISILWSRIAQAAPTRAEAFLRISYRVNFD